MTSRFVKNAVATAGVAAVGIAADRTAGRRAALTVVWVGCGGTFTFVMLGAMYAAPGLYVLAALCIVIAVWAWIAGYQEQQRLIGEQLAEQSQRAYAEQMIAEQHPSWVTAPAPVQRRVTRTVTVANRPAEAPVRPQETCNDVAAPTAPPQRPTLILPRYSGRSGQPHRREDRNGLFIDDYRGFDPDLGE